MAAYCGSRGNLHLETVDVGLGKKSRFVFQYDDRSEELRQFIAYFRVSVSDIDVAKSLLTK